MKPVAVVTGASRGIGAAILRRLSSAGYRCVVIGQNAPAATDAEFFRADLTELRETQRAADYLRQVAGEQPVGLLVNNAGGATPARLTETDSAQLHCDVTLNLTSPMLLTGSVLPGMCESGTGAVVNIASTAGRVGVAYLHGYSAAKAGLIAFTQSVAAEYTPRGVRAYCVCPGAVATEMASQGRTELSRLHRLEPDDYETGMAGRTGLGRLVQPEEVAEVVEWLATRGSCAISGQTLNVCGTLTMG